jgi:hypothetical protein
MDRIVDCQFRCHHPLGRLECVAGTTGLEPTTFAATVNSQLVTLRNQWERTARFNTLGNPWSLLVCPSCVRVLALVLGIFSTPTFDYRRQKARTFRDTIRAEAVVPGFCLDGFLGKSGFLPRRDLNSPNRTKTSRNPCFWTVAVNPAKPRQIARKGSNSLVLLLLGRCCVSPSWTG